MTGPEHYREAERLIAMARDQGGGADRFGFLYREAHVTPAVILADAQVHATLALAAATGVT